MQIGVFSESESDRVTPVDSTLHAYRTVRAAILHGELAPGASFSQVQLAAQLGVSRTPLREALRLLQNEGLVQADYNRRVRVAPLSVEDLEQLYTMRIALEPLAVGMSVSRLTAPELASLDDALEEINRAGTARDLAAGREAHRRFHFTLFCHVGDRLRLEVESLWEYAERYRIQYQRAGDGGVAHMELARCEHEAMLEVARTRNADACARLVAEHLSRIALTVIAGIDAGHDPEGVRRSFRLAVGSLAPGVG